MHAQLLQILIRELAQEAEIDGIALKDFRILRKSELSKPLSDAMHLSAL